MIGFFGAHVSSTSFSQRHESPVASLEAPPIHFDQPAIDVVVLEVFGEGLYDNSLLHLYASHAARHV